MDEDLNDDVACVRRIYLETAQLSGFETLEKPLFEMCWFYMSIAQIALEPPPLCQKGKRGKKVPQTILASSYTPGQHEKKCPKLT